MYSMKIKEEKSNPPTLKTASPVTSINGLTENPSAKRDVINLTVDEENQKKKKILIILLSVIAVLSIGALLYGFMRSDGMFESPIPNNSDNGDMNSGITDKSKMYENPINGVYFSQEEALKFKDLKPIAVMVNNYVVARPSAGLSKADIVYEVVAEAGITRLMPVFHSQIPSSVSSVRSARYYFVQLASAYSAHYIHWGAAHVPPCQKASPTSSAYCPPVGGKVETNPEVDAYDWIVKLGVPNLDGGNYSCDSDKCAFGRDPDKVGRIPLEHTAFVRLPLIFDLAKDIRTQESWHKYVPITEWLFKDDAKLADRGDIGLITPITYNYWDTMAGFNVKWVYDKEKNMYARYQGDVKQTDALDGSALMAKVVIVRLTKEEAVGDKKNHLYQGIVGSGNALIFQDGTVIKAKWNRSNPDVRDIYADMTGKQLELNRGQIWVQLVPIGNAVMYEKAIESVNSVSTN
ncbi:hypothetical protein CO178_01415 [candidate division WWE3 bacterium CG_4_9_14_3_um_filter_34_6]|uniref:DUF3048 domain-containing protein n=1 Tax=candidate division WWE3 bacterium CG_4_9_14_3_um_filter_34_6 TaxID=1975079 RepID=A0A2M7X3Z6_UNCKA|nr:MAG: hypothetical protein CO178_01415 [candidate division WWE3 bacterium CG_4_9_14_3_um_filter_34_6]